MNSKNPLYALLLALMLTIAPVAVATDINNAMSDAWVTDDASFQGMLITVYKTMGLVFVAWFTFDSVPPGNDITAVVGAADHRWISALGTISGDTATLTIENTSGGRFNAAEPRATQDTSYGTMTIVFNTCNSATVMFNMPSAGESGSFEIKRALEDNVELCESM